MSPFTFDLTPLADFDANNWALTKGGFAVQAKAFDRAKRIDIDRVMLTTMPGDTNIAGSGELERCDLTLNVEQSLGYEGSDAWYAITPELPDDFQRPTWQPYNLGGFHSTGPGPGANLEIRFRYGVVATHPGELCIQGFGGDPAKAIEYGTLLSVPIERYRPLPFVFHVRWASDTGGFVNIELAKKPVLLYAGPTLFVGQQTYLKLANYHLPDGSGKPSSVIHWLPKVGSMRSDVEATA